MNTITSENLARAITFLNQEQLADGSFYSYNSADFSNFTIFQKHKTTFSASLILYSLNECRLDELAETKLRLNNYLITQKGTNWAYKYWDENSPEKSYPADLDDTSCALLAINAYAPESINGDIKAGYTNNLLACERNIGGPYFTWIVNKDDRSNWENVDVAVNANINALLIEWGVILESLTSYLDECIRDTPLSSDFYPNRLVIYYFLARNYRGNKLKMLLELLNNEYSIQTNSPLNAALMITSMLNLGIPKSKLVNQLDLILSSQNDDGSWSAESFFADPDVDGKKTFAGSEALTTSICLEAILRVNQQESVIAFSNSRSRAEALLCFGLDNNSDMLQQLKVVLNQYSDELINQLISLPEIIQSAGGYKLSAEQLKKLVGINIYGWVAYTIYDDLIDGDSDMYCLPLMLLSLRKLHSNIYGLANGDSNFLNIANHLLSNMDIANEWELQNARATVKGNDVSIAKMPKYTDSRLSDKSIGHAISGLGVIYLSVDTGKRDKEAEAKNYLKFMECYLVAKQLNDDMHDWEDDLKYGIITQTVSKILRAWERETNKNIRNGIDIKLEQNRLLEIFWNEIVVEQCHKVLKLVEAAELAIELLTEWKFNKLQSLLNEQKNTARLTLKSQRDAKEYIRVIVKN